MRVVPSCLVVLAAATSAGSCDAAEPGRKPNIVYIMADDLGYTDQSCYGSRFFETPNIDRLAAQGMRFTDAYTCSSNCQPTRAALISGQYGPRTGVYTVGEIDRFPWWTRTLRPVDNVTTLPPEKVTLAQALKAAGYATGMFGKWHLGQEGDEHPARRGFDEAIVSSSTHFNFKTDPEVAYPPGTYQADFLTEKALDFIDRHKAGPFLLYLPHFGVHSSFEAKEELIARFRGKSPVGGHGDPTYAAMIASVDESVGRIVEALDDLGLSEDTLVIFSSDNGGLGGYTREGVTTQMGEVTDNVPLRGGKGMFFEGGIRIPHIARWPGRVPAGTTCDVPVISVDLYPTLLAVAGAEAPRSYILDGTSYLDLLTGSDTSRDREPLYWHFPGYLGAAPGNWRTAPVGVIRDGDWKLFEYFEDGRLVLYNLRDDIGETTDVSAARPDVAQAMHAKLLAWRRDVGAKMPTPNVPRAERDAESDGGE